MPLLFLLSMQFSSGSYLRKADSIQFGWSSGNAGCDLNLCVCRYRDSIFRGVGAGGVDHPTPPRSSLLPGCLPIANDDYAGGGSLYLSHDD